MTDASQNSIPNIANKAAKPPGLMPKNLQAIIVSGIALLMVLIMALTGHRQPNFPTDSMQSPLPTPLPVNPDKVSDFQKSIEEKQRESAPQIEAALLKQQQRQQSEQNQISPYGTPVSAPYANGTYPPGAYAAPPPQPTAPQAAISDPIKDDQKKRQYLSLFADNVALTHRKDAAEVRTTAQQTVGVTPIGSQLNIAPAGIGTPNTLQTQDQILSREAAQLAQEEQLLQQAQQAGLYPQRSLPHPLQSPTRETDQAAQTPATQAQLNRIKEKAPNPNEPIPSAFNSAEGNQYVLFEGTMIESLLINRLDGSFAGPVSCFVTDPLYSHDRQHLLIPAGAKVLGEASKVDTFGQARLAVAFHRLIMPDGYSVSLDQFKGLDQTGATALKDKINNHYVKTFGASLAVGIIGGIAQVGTGSVLTNGGADRIRQGFGASIGQAAEQILDRFLNILPTVTIREGTRVKIYLSNDLLLPDYQAHTVPSNL